MTVATFHLTDKTTGLGDFVGPVFFELAPVEKASRQSFFRDLALVASLIALAMVISFAKYQNNLCVLAIFAWRDDMNSPCTIDDGRIDV